MGPLPSLDFVSRPETPGAPALLSKEGLLDKRDEELKQEVLLLPVFALAHAPYMELFFIRWALRFLMRARNS
jgi:hypothetical protein